jgi:hypothetical protein
MSNLIGHLDRLTDKLKKKVNNKIDRLGHNTKFETSNFKKSSKSSYWENNDKPKRIKSTAEIIVTLILTVVIGIIIISIVLFFNANLIFLIKIASPAFYKEAFPAACNEMSFDPKSGHPCNIEEKWNEKDVELLENALEFKPSTGGGNSCKKSGAGFPYNFFNKKSSGIGKEYINWFLTSLANTDMKLNSHVKGILENKMLKSVPNGIMIILGILILALLPIVSIFTFWSLFSNQLWTAFEQEFGVIVLILITGFILLGTNCIISIFNILKIWFKLVLYPAVSDNWKHLPEIQTIMGNEKLVIGYFIGLVFVITLLSTPLNKYYSGWVKGVTASVFALLVILHSLVYLHHLWNLHSNSSCEL